MLRKCKRANVDEKERTILMQKDREKGKAESNYRPITYLSLVSTLLTGVIAEEIYGFLDTNVLLPQDQKKHAEENLGASLAKIVNA